MKPKRQYVPGPMDNCQTPAYALTPILPYLPRRPLWEPAAGNGNIVRALTDKGWTVVGTDILTGQDFFTCDPPFDHGFFGIITNPPYSLKFKWLERCIQFERPFALLVPVEMIGAKQCQDIVRYNGFEMMLLNRRVNFEMPNKGYNGTGAQFPVMWLTWHILPQQVMFGEIVQDKRVKA